MSTGVVGLNSILRGGLPESRLHLIEGNPGTGKTTLGLQFLLEGARRGETGLYITLSESRDELIAVAASHGWSLDGIEIMDLSDLRRCLPLLVELNVPHYSADLHRLWV